jgi:hypothetical protein
MKVQLGYNLNNTQNYSQEVVDQPTRQIGQFGNLNMIPYFAGGVDSLNTMCFELNAAQTVFVSDFQSQRLEVVYEVNRPGQVQTKKIHEALKTIPIYRQVLNLKNQDTYKFYENVESTDRYSKNSVISQNDTVSTPRNERKRRSSGTGTNSQLMSSSYSQENSIPNECNLPITYQKELKPMNNSNISVCLPTVQEQSDSLVNGNKCRQIFEPQKTSTAEQKTISKPIPLGYVQIQKQSSINRKTKVITKCNHVDRKHYAKGLCSTCYHRSGRTKTAWKCQHTDQLHYAKGCCQECYLTFHSKRGKNRMKKLLTNEKNNL